MNFVEAFTVEEALGVADQVIFAATGKHLSDVQQAILQGSFQSLTYEKIAESYGCTPEYLGQDAGPSFWKLLTQALGEKVSKNNFRSALKRRWKADTQTTAIADPIAQAETESNGLTEDCSLFSLNSQTYVDWDAAPDVSFFLGRTKELSQLQQWIVLEGCRLVALTGIGGIGKTALAVKLAQIMRGQFEFVLWRSLDQRPLLPSLLADLNQFLSHQSEGGQGFSDLPTFLSHLRNHRCLILLDGWEAILQNGVHSGAYCEGYENYGEFLERISSSAHQSVVLLTSREKPKAVAVNAGERHPVRSIMLEGLGELTGQEIFIAKGNFSGSEGDLRMLIKLYDGHPLALNVVANTILEIFSGDIVQFLDQLTDSSAIFGDMRDLLDRQFHRLSDLEKTVVQCLAEYDAPLSMTTLLQALPQVRSPMQLQEVLQSLVRRSFLEAKFAKYSLQPLLAEYLALNV
ncbi:MAG: hypothetical protein KME16_01565 [Scytolyngbya sp. HA4215-MV1]|jgi:hypothetical protein|nr:hypothetical protein [Scytolyngbya sp. HA4215-MV1]